MSRTTNPPTALDDVRRCVGIARDRLTRGKLQFKHGCYPAARAELDVALLGGQATAEMSRRCLDREPNPTSPTARVFVGFVREGKSVATEASALLAQLGA